MKDKTVSSNEPGDFITVSSKGVFQYEEKRSVFIGQAVPAADEAQAKAFIENVKKERYDARHNVYAYIVSDGAFLKYSDDGEPQGTAGVPVLNSIKMSGAVNLCVTVTRYFGGILLGAGGLVRAYSSAASGAIKAAGLVTMEDFIVYETACTYAEYQKLSDALERRGAVLEGSDFSDEVKMRFSVEKNLGSEAERFIVEATSGKSTVNIIDIEKRQSRKKVEQ